MKFMQGNVKDEKKKHKLMLDFLKNHFLEDEQEMANREDEEESEENLEKSLKIPDRPFKKEIEKFKEWDDEDDRMPPLSVKGQKRKLYRKNEVDDEEDENEQDDYEDDDEDEDQLPKHKRKELIIMMLGKKMRKNKHGNENM
jgi:hypothetical protein